MMFRFCVRRRRRRSHSRGRVTATTNNCRGLNEAIRLVIAAILCIIAHHPLSSSTIVVVMAQQLQPQPLQTLAPFAPIPVEATTPTLSPMIMDAVTTFLTYSPSHTDMPTAKASSFPTIYPTSSLFPTSMPSTSSLPTVTRSEYPSLSPVYAPSSTPSTDTAMIVQRSFQQILQVESSEEFTDVQRKIYQLLMQSYTLNFGYMVTDPLIVTTAIVTDQNLAVGRRNVRRKRRRIRQRGRRMQSQVLLPVNNLLLISFTMQYTTKYGYNTIEDYPALFQSYINSNLENVTVDMYERFLPVLKAQPVIMYVPISTGVPSPAPSTLSPQYGNGGGGGGGDNQPTMAPNSSSINEGKTNFVVGLAVGLVVAVILVIGIIGYRIRKKKRRKKQRYSYEHARHNKQEQDDDDVDQEGIEVRVEDVLLPDGMEIILPSPVNTTAGMTLDPLIMQQEQQQMHQQQQQQQYQPEQQQYQLEQQQRQQHLLAYQLLPSPQQQTQTSSQQLDEYAISEGYNDASSTQPIVDMDGIADSILSNPSMISDGFGGVGVGSFSSNPDDYYPGMIPYNNSNDNDNDHDDDEYVHLDTLQDEFDNYKNQDLEHMRSGVEESVQNAEGMMSLAMTRALMGEENSDIPSSWAEAEGDPESIEANGLCETNDWLRKNEHSTLDERNHFFQELLNIMVITVRRGLLSPQNGTLTIHCCAAMLGLQLEKELPNNVILVQGMRKTNDLSQGRVYLIEAFHSFGDIESAGIAPSNRGFGFVRFVSPKSVQRALERFRISEIEVQDVSVMIKSLNDFSPAV